MKKKLADFTGIYQLSQTLKFELRPIGATEKNLIDSGLLEQDHKRAEDYPKVKEFLDERHKAFLQKTLSKINDIDWQPLANALDEFRRDNVDRKGLESKFGEYRKKIIDRIKSNEEYGILVEESTPSKLFKQEIEQNPEVLAEVRTFGRFACYFKGYQENRANIYSAEAQQTSAAHRAVDDNFTKFATAVKLFSECMVPRDDLMCELEKHSDLAGKDIAELFNISSYNLFLPQRGIEIFNQIVSAVNYVVNQYRQQHPEIPARELPFLPPLFKQILSDRELKFATVEFENDDEVCKALRDFVERNRSVTIHEKENLDLFACIQQLFAILTPEDDLFVDAAELDKISKESLGRWDALRDLMGEYAEQTFRTKSERKKYCGQDVFHFRDLNAWVKTTGCASAWLGFWRNDRVAKLFETERRLRDAVAAMDAGHLRERKDDVAAIKEYLDAVQELLHILKPLAVGAEYGGDLDRLGIIQEVYDALAEVIPLYNRTRNYMTRKVSETGKIKLMFDNPTLADGWDSNKELANTAVIFIRDGAYFLGIMNPKSKTDFTQLACYGTGPCYKKVMYKLLPGPNKMLPKVFFSKKNIDYYAPSDELLTKYKAGIHQKGVRFDLSFCHELIDFFKRSISRHPDWSKFGFEFSDTSSYDGIDKFYKEIADQGYKITFSDIPAVAVDKLVEDGKLFLFQIWNKDFAAGATGTPNKSTLYWKALFDSRNLADVVFKLNGEAELFFRDAAIKEKVVHRAGEKLVNRTIVTAIRDGKAERAPISEKIYYEIFRYVNGRLDEPLSKDAAALLEKRLDWKPGMRFEATLDRLVVKEAKLDLIKDKRFTEKKYLFHVPLTINFKSPDRAAKFNDSVNEFLRDDPDVKVIGIDRGERNLIYIALTDRQGRLLEQRSFNVVGGVDYQKKLDCRERERDAARKSWSEIGKIKDLKAGYLSGVVHEIAEMMVRHNAVVVMEDLNFGFKRGRSKIEKQVYQKFERALIEKLNYLVFKNTVDPQAPGGVLNGYQLTNKFESFKKLGKQCGFIFYVPAQYTSAIDPATGFVDFFGGKYLRYESAAKSRNFFSKFDAVRYLPDQGVFEFDFDYKKVTGKEIGGRSAWRVCSFGDRLENIKDASEHWTARRVDITAELKSLFARAGIALDGELLPQILARPETNTDFWRDLLRLFKLTVQLRNSVSNSTDPKDDYIISPVRDKDGNFFDSRNAGDDMPRDADANGAYNIARKGLLLLEKIRGSGSTKLELKDWLRSVQRA